MRTITLAAAAATALLSIVAVQPVRAQLMTLDPDAPELGLDPHQVRVVELALRDAGCYHGRIDGEVGAQVRSALRCAAGKVDVRPGDSRELARALDLYAAADAPAMSTREAGGDVAPAATRRMAGDTTMRERPARDSTMRRSMMRDSTMRRSMMRDSTMRRSMMRDSMRTVPPVATPDSTVRPTPVPPDSMATPRPDSTVAVPSIPPGTPPAAA